jgi:hypothetical protein
MIEAVAKQIVAALSEKPLEINDTPLRVDAEQLEILFPEIP